MTPSTDPILVLRGQPKDLDVVWRPLSRAFLIGGGLLCAVALYWWDDVWLAPLPLLIGAMVHGLLFWVRGDRPMTLRVSPSALDLNDRKTGRKRVVQLSSARTLSLATQRMPSGYDRLFVTLHTDNDAILALECITPSRPWPAPVADLDVLQPILGGRTTLLRGLATPPNIVRQALVDRDGAFADRALSWLHDIGTDKVSVRVWVGNPPEVDFMGQLAGPPNGLLTLSPGRWRLATPQGARDGALNPGPGGSTNRTIPLLDGGAPSARKVSLPLFLLTLDTDLTVALPAPLLGHRGQPRPLHPSDLHTHLPEAASLLWWCLRFVAASELPKEVIEAVSDARIVEQPLPQWLLDKLADLIPPSDTGDRPSPAPSQPPSSP
jgi:hypothetical protein